MEDVKLPGLSLTHLSTEELTKKLILMMHENQEKNPLFNAYLNEAKKRLKIK